MSTAPEPARIARHQTVLDEQIELGHELTRLVVDQAKTGAVPVATASIAFDRVTRDVRRAILTSRKLCEPLPTVDRVAARKQIIRTVEDAIQRDAEDEDEADALQAELLDRLDSLDLEDEIAARPADAIITDIARDLGLAHIPGTHPWKRRTPEDLVALRERAEQHPGVDRTTVLSQGSKGQRPLASLRR